MKKPTEEEIYLQIDRAIEDPQKFSGMSYMEGVQAALEWVLGITEATPTED